MKKRIENAFFLIIGIFIILLCILLIWVNIKNAPIDVPTQITLSSAPLLNPYPELEGIKIPLNSASVEDLSILPGIGEKKAHDIYEYVKQHKPVTSLNQLLEVDGIGKKTLDNISPFLTLE